MATKPYAEIGWPYYQKYDHYRHRQATRAIRIQRPLLSSMKQSSIWLALVKRSPDCRCLRRAYRATPWQGSACTLDLTWRPSIADDRVIVGASLHREFSAKTFCISYRGLRTVVAPQGSTMAVCRHTSS